jgi:hypothetical protein
VQHQLPTSAPATSNTQFCDLVDCYPHGYIPTTTHNRYSTPLRIGFLFPSQGGQVYSQLGEAANDTIAQEGYLVVVGGHHTTKQLALGRPNIGRLGHSMLGKPKKNRHKNAILHHTSSLDASLNLVKSAAILIHAVCNLPDTTPIGSFVDNLVHIQHITSDKICGAIHNGAIHANLVVHRYTMSRIGSRSIQSGGAMPLKLAGYDNDIFQKLGHCSSTTYLHYTQTQIGQLTAGMAQHMASVALQFHIVA